MCLIKAESQPELLQPQIFFTERSRLHSLNSFSFPHLFPHVYACPAFNSVFFTFYWKACCLYFPCNSTLSKNVFVFFLIFPWKILQVNFWGCLVQRFCLSATIQSWVTDSFKIVAHCSMTLRRAQVWGTSGLWHRLHGSWTPSRICSTVIVFIEFQVVSILVLVAFVCETLCWWNHFFKLVTKEW